ncbi:MAG: hypothetical protein ACHQUC_02770 [Chlamydiales bacterium]
MRSIYALLFAGLIFCGSFLHSDPPSTLGYAIHPSKFDTPFPSSAQVKLKRLVESSKDVSLLRGSLNLPTGIYRLSYGVDLQNIGGDGMIRTWLTFQTSPLEPPTVIPFSTRHFAVAAADGDVGFSLVQVFASLYFAWNTNFLVSIHYSTTGDVNLTTLPCITPCCHVPTINVFTKPPVPFYLNALRFKTS